MTSRRLFRVSAAALLAQIATWPVHAQTARDVVCTGCVGSRDVRDESLSGRDVKNGSLTGSDIKNGSIGPSDLAAGAKPTGAAISEPSDAVDIPTDLTAVVSITVVLPARGAVVLHGSYSIFFKKAGAAVSCGIARDGVNSSGDYSNFDQSFDAGHQRSASLQILMTETSGGAKTYRLLCEANDTAAIDIYTASLLATYVPSGL